ncbi:uncharacterized protein LOC117182776 [Belonocnema kinseyi]|uniref:uncharacterized protein LOC117182776 n=1 Tax=Belonocnema kinseyi TaxID=2817044 RepID=UPI00143D7B2C|nr:uncharacterized protein LOC117182776 [Belonocnema kinseyi]
MTERENKTKKSATNVLADFQFVDFSVSELPTILAREFDLEDDQPDSQKKRPKIGEEDDSRYSSGFKQFVVRELIKIKAQLDNIQQGQQQLVSKIEVVEIEPKEANAMDRFMEEYSLNLPFKSVTEFEHFDLTLRANPIARNKFMNSLLDLFDRNHIATKTLVTIMKKYMSRDVALSYTAVKPVKDKLVLKGTTFCKCVINVLLKNHVDKVTGNKATEQTLLSALGSVLANAKDWEGYRARRFKSSMQRDDNESSN